MNKSILLMLSSFAVLLCTLCGCAAPHSQFVLLPAPDGHVGRVTVTNKAGEMPLEKPFESVDLLYPNELPSQSIVLTEAEVNTIFKEALAALPVAPVTYLLYFEPGTSRLTQESEKLLPQIMEYIHTNNSKDISISGHSDKVGSREVNIRISRERAEVIAQKLIESGLPPESLAVASHGMELPLVDTPEGTPEPRNRRVELVVR